MSGKHQVARVAVADEQWVAFRQAALAQGVSVSAYLGRLVEKELLRRAGRPVSAVEVDRPEPEQAIGALAEVRASIDELDGIAGRLARSATKGGASWAEVASSLRMTSDVAKSAYERRS